MLDGSLAMAAALRAEFPWFATIIDSIEDQLRFSFALNRPYLRLRPMLIAGPPGCGKSRFANRLAALSGCGFGLFNAAGSTDNRLLAGTARGWNSAQPSWPAQVIAQTRCPNPVLVIDEIDKVTYDPRNGRIIDTLLTMLEAETGRRWMDDCLITPLNLSAINWVMTANDSKALSAPLLSRLELFEIGQPEATHFPAVYQGILRDIAEDNRCTPDQLPWLGADTEQMLAELFATVRCPRRLKVAVSRALSIALRPQAGPSN
jgi:hypothetical protein